MAIVFNSMNVFFMEVLGILSFSFKIFIEGICVVARAPIVMTISRSTFHCLFIIELISGWYFSDFLFMISYENPSLYYVNSMNCIVMLSLWIIGGSNLYGKPFIQSIYGLNLAL